ncbi:MAG TPA: class I SAM-dependent methyltransferase [Gemmatimonadaceae bacterium]|nr:class I SAM-dependent methyltransferase [Gemmatimonadaceae bacterium]
MSRDSFSNLLVIVAGVVSAVIMSGQCRKPGRWLGRLIAKGMNQSHAPMTTWGLSHITVNKDFTILDVGCGGGKTVDTLACLAPQGRVFGIDYSAGSVAAARGTNAARIADGRVAIQRGTVSHLPFAADTFDLVTASETHYYWPDLPRDVSEVQRVLKPGGTFIIIAEVYRGRNMDWLFRPAMAMLSARYLTLDQHRELLAQAGYTGVEVEAKPSKGWMIAKGTKPGDRVSQA